MTSYQKRKEEIKELKKERIVAQALAREIKHYFLAMSKGQEAHAEQCKKAILKRIPLLWDISEYEKEAIQNNVNL